MERLVWGRSLTDRRTDSLRISEVKLGFSQVSCRRSGDDPIFGWSKIWAVPWIFLICFVVPDSSLTIACVVDLFITFAYSRGLF